MTTTVKMPELVGTFYVDEGSGTWTQYRRAPAKLTDGDCVMVDMADVLAYGDARMLEERERCAKVCEAQVDPEWPNDDISAAALNCAFLIRAGDE